MNPDEISSAVTKAAIAILTWLAARYLPNDPSASYIPTIAAGIGAAAAFGYGVYRHWNQKKVPEGSVAVATTAPASIGPGGAVTVTGKVVGALAALALTGAFLCPGAAHAQSNRVPKLTGNPVKDIGNAINPEKQAESVEANIMADLAKPFQDLADFIGSDNSGAIALSTAIPELQDGHGQQCWIAMKAFGDVIKAHPVPLTLKVQTDLEALRLLGMAANNLCANPHCTQVFADLANNVQAAAPLNASIAIPSLNSLCSKVPQIAVAPPIQIPATPASATISTGAAVATPVPGTIPATSAPAAAPANP